MEQKLKRKLCNYLIMNNLVKPYQVINHSYSSNRMGGGYAKHDKHINICPTLDTRCDCLGVVVYERD